MIVPRYYVRTVTNYRDIKRKKGMNRTNQTNALMKRRLLQSSTTRQQAVLIKIVKLFVSVGHNFFNPFHAMFFMTVWH